MMKICALQPSYPEHPSQMAETVEWLLKSLDTCDDSVDLVVLPEACNAMTVYDSLDEFYQSIEIYSDALIKKARETAVRCKALVAINLYTGEQGTYRNTTLIFNQQGALVGEYLKQHLPEAEAKKIDGSYTQSYREPYILDMDGIRYGFLTCYDCYFSEYIQHIAAHKPDVLIVCALQRGEHRDILDAQMKNAAFVCNAYAVRSSVSMGGPEHEYGANSMIVSPQGKVLSSLGQQVGVLCCEVDPKEKHYRPDSFGQPDIRNDLFIEKGRTPWAYRACGASVRPGDAQTPYPRICAHRGFNTVAPENTMPAFGAAIALGADEIELDVWPTKDGELLVCHDETVDRTADGQGRIMDLTWQEIQTMDTGRKYSEAFTGLRFSLLDDVLARFARQVIVNLHIKSPAGTESYDEELFGKIVRLIERYDMQQHVYIAGEEDVLRTACKIAPHLPRAALDGKLDFQLVNLARKYGCQKLQLFRGYYNQDMIDDANKSGIRCNLFWSDDPAEVPQLIENGIDTILTNDYLRVATAFNEYKRREMAGCLKKEDC